MLTKRLCTTTLIICDTGAVFTQNADTARSVTSLVAELSLTGVEPVGLEALAGELDPSKGVHYEGGPGRRAVMMVLAFLVDNLKWETSQLLPGQADCRFAFTSSVTCNVTVIFLSFSLPVL